MGPARRALWSPKRLGALSPDATLPKPRTHTKLLSTDTSPQALYLQQPGYGRTTKITVIGKSDSFVTLDISGEESEFYKI